MRQPAILIAHGTHGWVRKLPQEARHVRGSRGPAMWAHGLLRGLLKLKSPARAAVRSKLLPEWPSIEHLRNEWMLSILVELICGMPASLIMTEAFD